MKREQLLKELEALQDQIKKLDKDEEVETLNFTVICVSGKIIQYTKGEK